MNERICIHRNQKRIFGMLKKSVRGDDTEREKPSKKKSNSE